MEHWDSKAGQVGKELVERPKNKYQANSYCIRGLHKYWCNEKRDGESSFTLPFSQVVRLKRPTRGAKSVEGIDQ